MMIDKAEFEKIDKKFDHILEAVDRLDDFIVSAVLSARNAAFEEAAVIAETYGAGMRQLTTHEVRTEIAARIRAAISQERGTNDEEASPTTT